MKLCYTYIMCSIINYFLDPANSPLFTIPIALKFGSLTPNSSVRNQNEPKTENVPKLIRQWNELTYFRNNDYIGICVYMRIRCNKKIKIFFILVFVQCDLYNRAFHKKNSKFNADCPVRTRPVYATETIFVELIETLGKTCLTLI